MTSSRTKFATGSVSHLVKQLVLSEARALATTESTVMAHVLAVEFEMPDHDPYKALTSVKHTAPFDMQLLEPCLSAEEMRSTSRTKSVHGVLTEEVKRELLRRAGEFDEREGVVIAHAFAMYYGLPHHDPYPKLLAKKRQLRAQQKQVQGVLPMAV